MLKIKFTAFLMIAFLLQVNAQEFLTPSNTFSHKQTSYVTLKDGTEKKGTLSNIDRKKGLIKLITIGIAGVTLAGGNAKSYYVKTEGESVAYKLTKKGYKKEFKPYWTKCSAVTEKFTDVKWTELPKHIVEYSETCGK